MLLKIIGLHIINAAPQTTNEHVLTPMSLILDMLQTVRLNIAWSCKLQTGLGSLHRLATDFAVATIGL